MNTPSSAGKSSPVLPATGWHWLFTAWEQMLGVKKLRKLCLKHQEHAQGAALAQRILEDLVLPCQLTGCASTLPASGPAVVVLHNSFGLLESLVVLTLLRTQREDCKIFTPSPLVEFRGLDSQFFTLRENQRDHNFRTLRAAARWVQQGGVLVLFAWKESATTWPGWRSAASRWHPSVGRLLRLLRAPVLPAVLLGRKRLAAYSLKLWPDILIPPGQAAKLARFQRAPIQLALGKWVSATKIHSLALPGHQGAGAVNDYLALRCATLREIHTAAKSQAAWQRWKRLFPSREIAQLEPVIAAIPPEELWRELQTLPDGQRLANSNQMVVYYAHAKQIPMILREIGRLREITFRGTGEGTGKALDLDVYDDFYLHLFVWEQEKHEIVGAYRLGRVDEILRRFGKKGLYTYSLFKYKRRLLDQINPALEMGRSFVREEYQRNVVSLFLLWKGIAHYVLRNPHYRILFGPVSISNEYNSLSQQLLVNFLQEHNYKQDLARLVKPRRPFQAKKIKTLCNNRHGCTVKNIDEVSELVAQIETDNKGVPVLLKQYLKLGGQLLGFNVDKDFSNVVDGLIMVDLLKTDAKIMSRYWGKEGTEQFVAYHQALVQKQANPG